MYRGLEGLRAGGLEDRAKGSAKVQIGAELLCKSANVSLGVGTGAGVGRFFQMSRGRDVITIASALTPDGCDVIASLPKAITPPILHTRYSILLRHLCTFAQAVGRLRFCTCVSYFRASAAFARYQA